MKVDEELKSKRAELLGEVEELTARIQAINGQVAAIDQVIAIYEPGYAPLGTVAPKPSRPRAAKQLPPEFARISRVDNLPINFGTIGLADQLDTDFIKSSSNDKCAAAFSAMPYGDHPA